MLTRPIVGRTEASSSSPGARFLLDKFVTTRSILCPGHLARATWPGPPGPGQSGPTQPRFFFCLLTFEKRSL